MRRRESGGVVQGNVGKAAEHESDAAAATLPEQALPVHADNEVGEMLDEEEDLSDGVGETLHEQGKDGLSLSERAQDNLSFREERRDPNPNLNRMCLHYSSPDHDLQYITYITLL